MKKFKLELIFQLLIAVVIGILVGLVCSHSIIGIINMVKYILGQIIFFTVPLVILAFVTSSISHLREGASKLLTFAIIIAYISTIGAALMSVIAGYSIIPNLNIASNIEDLRELPKLIFELSIPPVMSVMSALVLSIFVGLSIAWAKAEKMLKLVDEFQNMILFIVKKIIMPILPYFIGCTFAILSYEGGITKHFPVFISVLLITIFGHYIWLAVLYIIAGIYSKTPPSQVLKHFLPAYLTAIGTMSSAATLPITLDCADKSPALRKDMVAFGIPLFANIHLCGSVLTETFFVMVVSQILYGSIPSVSQMIIFIILLGIFGLGAPGVPGGTVMASLGLITSILGFDANGIALVLAIFALQDSFGTACNVTSDGALTLMLNKYAIKHKLVD